MTKSIFKTCCPQCGTVVEVEIDDDVEEGDWLPCVAPTSFEWTLPAGKISPVVGDPIYVSAMGEHLSREAFLQKYNVDPEIAYQKMRGKKR